MLGGGPSHVSAHVSAPAPAGASPGRSIPPPKVVVAARGVGPITEPNVNDVLSGRGGRINAHPGNVGFRSLIAAHKARYLSPATRKLEKAHIAAEVVEAVRGLDPPGRFLKQDSEDGAWWDIGDVNAITKVGEALRGRRHASTPHAPAHAGKLVAAAQVLRPAPPVLLGGSEKRRRCC